MDENGNNDDLIQLMMQYLDEYSNRIENDHFYCCLSQLIYSHKNSTSIDIHSILQSMIKQIESGIDIK